MKNLNGLNTELERNGDFPQNLPVIAAEKTPDPPGQTSWSSQCPPDVMSLSGSAHSELPLLSKGTDSPVPWPGGQRRDLEDREGTWRSNAGVVLALS